MHIRMLGHTVQLCRWQVSYKIDDMDMVEYVPTEEEADDIAQRYNGVKSALTLFDDEWMDGLEVADVPDTYAEAMRIYSLGEQVYKQQIEDNKKRNAEQLRADIDFLSIMTGVTL